MCTHHRRRTHTHTYIPHLTHTYIPHLTERTRRTVSETRREARGTLAPTPSPAKLPAKEGRFLVCDASVSYAQSQEYRCMRACVRYMRLPNSNPQTDTHTDTEQDPDADTDAQHARAHTHTHGRESREVERERQRERRIHTYTR